MKLNQIKVLDSLWAKRIKQRAGNLCEYCREEKRKFNGGPGIWLEAAHIIGRTHRTTRWLLENGVALCSGCHAAYDQHLPLEKEIRTWLITEERYERLRNMPVVKASEQNYLDERAKLMTEANKMEENAKKSKRRRKQ